MSALSELYDLFNNTVDAAIRIAKAKPQADDLKTVKQASLDVEVWLEKNNMKTDKDGRLVEPSAQPAIDMVTVQRMAALDRLCKEIGYAPIQPNVEHVPKTRKRRAATPKPE